MAQRLLRVTQEIKSTVEVPGKESSRSLITFKEWDSRLYGFHLSSRILMETVMMAHLIMDTGLKISIHSIRISARKQIWLHYRKHSMIEECIWWLTSWPITWQILDVEIVLTTASFCPSTRHVVAPWLYENLNTNSWVEILLPRLLSH